ncbi:MAG TPA: transketolase C-terminal domain-containing protein [Verrucomicrobiae bacterium]|nr:transketolase C-terminal domain-containing protein [Verrucomicrobiae bacterium]
MRKTCLDCVYEIAKADPRVFFIGSDLGIGTLKQFKAEMPDRYFMEGVSEANLIGMSAGLALEGKVVYANTIATFITRRCFEQVCLDLCLHNVKVRLIGNGGGVVYAPLGPTHLATEDIAIMRALPRMTILAPADATEMRRMMPLTVDHPGPIYIRLAKGGDPIVTREKPFAIGKIFPMREGRDAVIITTGVMLQRALIAAETLHARGIEAAILHCPTVKPLDEDVIRDYAGQAPVIVTVEEHTTVGGLGSAVAEVIAEACFPAPKRFRRIGIPDVFPDQYGSQDTLLARYDITAEKICSTIEALQNGNRYH